MADANIRAVITAKDDASSVVSGFSRSVSSAFADIGKGSIAATALITAAGLALYKIGIEPAAQIQTAVQSMTALTGSAEDTQKILGELYSFVQGKPLTFPDAAQAAKTLTGYGVALNQVVPQVEAIGKLSVVSGGDINSLALAFGQVTSKGRLMGQETLQLVNQGVPVIKILAEHFHKSIEQMGNDMQGGTVSAADFNAAVQEYVGKIDISQFSNTFDNRLISLQGSLRNLAFELLGIKVDPIKGFTVEAGGLFDQLSNSVSWVAKHLKDLKPVMGTLKNNVLPIAIIIGSILVTGLIAAASALGLLSAPFLIFTAIVVAVGIAVQAIVKHFGGWDATLKKLQPAITFFKNVWNEITKIWNTVLLPALKAVWHWLQEHIFTQDNLNKAVKFAQETWKMLSHVWTDYVWPALQMLWDIIVNWVWPALQNMWKEIQKLIKTLSDWYDKNKDWLIPALQILAVVVGAILFGALLVIVVAIGIVVAIITVLIGIVNIVIGVFNWFQDTAKAVGHYLVDTFNGALKGVGDTFDWLYGKAKSFIDLIASIATGNLNGVKSAMKGLGVPGFASGVQNFSGGMALVGEQGPELVNLPPGSDVIPNHQMAKAGGGTTTININANIGMYAGTEMEKRKVAQSILDSLKDIANAKNMTVGDMLK